MTPYPHRPWGPLKTPLDEVDLTQIDSLLKKGTTIKNIVKRIKYKLRYLGNKADQQA